MRFREVPGFPAIFLDFVDGAGPVADLLPRPSSLSTLVSGARHAKARTDRHGALWKEVCACAQALEPGTAVRQGLERLSGGTSVAVVAIQKPVLFGGVLSSLAKTMTAVKLAACLTRTGVPALPVCLLVSETEAGEAEEELGFVDAEGSFRACTVGPALQVEGSGQFERRVSRAAGGWLDRLFISLDSRARAIPVLDTARRSHREGTPVKKAWSDFMQAVFQNDAPVILDFDHLSSAAVRSAVADVFGVEFTRVLSEWSATMRRAGYSVHDSWRLARGPEGAVLPDELLSALTTFLLLPSVATVADPCELPRWSALTALCRSVRLDPPQVWPRASFTVVDSRSRRLLTRYDIPSDLLYEGIAALLRRVLPEPDARDVTRKLGSLQDLAEGRVRALCGVLGSAAASAAGVARSRERIQYQLEKLAERSRAHLAQRTTILEARFRRLCARLAPEGCLQESRLAALQVLAEGSDGIVERLSDSMDITSRQHQFLNVD